MIGSEAGFPVPGFENMGGARDCAFFCLVISARRVITLRRSIVARELSH